MAEKILYPLTSPQLSIWYTEKMFPGTSISNIAGTLKIKDEFHFDSLEQAINLFIKNNKGIRLRLCLDENGTPKQYISEFEYQAIQFIDFSNHTDPHKAMFEWDTKETHRPFELYDNDLFYFIIFKLSDAEGGIYLKNHHIISDAWSMSIASNTIVDYYQQIRRNTIYDEGITAAQSYLSFIESELAYKNSNRFMKDKFFWEQQFAQIPEATILKSRKTNMVSSKSKRKTFVLPKKFTLKLHEYCSQNKVSPYPLFLSALSMYINRVSGKEDIIIGSPILNRLNQVEKNTIGMFVSTIPIRVSIKNHDSFSTFSQDVTNLCSSVFRHQKYPYDALLKHVREKHGFTENLFDIILSYQNSKFDKVHDIDISTRWHFNGHQSNSLTIHINDRDNDGVLILDFDYHSDLYFDKEIEFIYQHVLSLLWHALDNPEKEICKIEMLPESEKKKVLYDFNNTYKEYPKEKTIHQLFEEQVERTPDNIALIFEDQQLTYRELNEKANSLARKLRTLGVQPDDIVGILVHRSLEMIIGMMAVLKAGGAYLPIDPKLPDDRINYMLAECASKIVLSQKDLTKRIHIKTTILDLFSERNYLNSINNLENINKAMDLVYIIFTSGTTGNPKGVMIEHLSVNNFLHSVNKLIGIDEKKTTISIATASFDIFVFELFSSLTSGARLVLTNDHERVNTERLYQIFKKYTIHIVHGTPSVISLLLDYNEGIFKDVITFIIGGEQFTSNLLSQLKSKTTAKIFNGYGPSECTVGVTFKDLTPEHSINIGTPIANTQIYILDKHLNLVPIGIPGEIYIGGDSLGRGYLNQTLLTIERFIKNPFNPDKKIYKTGDIGKWYSKGEIEFLRRVDSQVKVNGYRIELEEIRNQIIKVQGVKDAVVIVQNLPHNKRTICAYIVSDCPLDNISEQLSLALPLYMIPTQWTYIEKVPITNNGKIDLDKLPKPAIQNHKGIYVMPKNEIELKIQKIWENVLKNEPISINDVISEIGGDSLDIVAISSAIYKTFGIELPVSDFKKVNTIQKMAHYINQRKNISIPKSDQICLIKEGTKNLFFVHGGNGEISNYIDLSDYIDGFTCWGIRFDYNHIYPSNFTINDLAQRYVNYIKSIQPFGPYNLAGWSIGGTIAYEMACILEKQREKIKFLGLFDSIAPRIWEDVSPFSFKGEMEFISAFFAYNSFELTLNSTIQDVWTQLIDHIKLTNSTEQIKTCIREDIRSMIPYFYTASIDEVLKYINRIRSLHNARALYYPSGIIESKIYLFNATENVINHYKDSCWNSFSRLKIVHFDIKADHYSLFMKPAIEELGRIINVININDEEIKEYA